MSNPGLIYHPDKVSIGSSVFADTKKGALNLKTVTIVGGEMLNNPDVSNESLSSIGAYIFYPKLCFMPRA